MRSPAGSIIKFLLLKEFFLEPPSKLWEPSVAVRQPPNMQATVSPLLFLLIRSILSRLTSEAEAPTEELLERARKTEGGGEPAEMAKIGVKNA